MAVEKKTLKGCGVVVAAAFAFLLILTSQISKSGSDPEKNLTPVAGRVAIEKKDEIVIKDQSETIESSSLSPPQKLPTAQDEVAPAVVEEVIFEAETPRYEPKPAALAALVPTPSRKWTNPEGKTVLGIVTAFNPIEETTTFRTAAGGILENFPLSKFGEADAEYLRDTARGILSGRVVGVHDGDSITLLVAGNTQFKIRLEAIDAPELGQEYGNNSKSELGDLVYGKDVTVHVTGLDKYKRVLGFVWITDSLVNQIMIERGLAWHFKEYSDDEKLAQAELDARDSKAGLWRDWKPMSPWEWRNLQKSNAAAKKAAELTTAQPFVSTPEPSTVTKEKPVASFWLNTSGGKRHNASCRWYGNTKSGRYCTKSEGSACGICGG